MYRRLFFFGKGEKKGQNVSEVAGNAYGEPIFSPPYLSHPPVRPYLSHPPVRPYLSHPPDFCEKKIC